MPNKAPYVDVELSAPPVGANALLGRFCCIAALVGMAGGFFGLLGWAATPIAISTPLPITWNATVEQGLNAAFAPRASGWLGGDACASIPLNTTHDMLVFGDTWYGTSGAGKRNATAFVHGSIALLRRTPGAVPDFFARPMAGAAGGLDPAGFFQPSAGGVHAAPGGDFYWVVNGASLGEDGSGSAEQLLLVAQVISPSATPAAINQTGSAVVLVRPRADLPPTAWPYHTAHIPGTDARVSFNTAVLYEAEPRAAVRARAP